MVDFVDTPQQAAFRAEVRAFVEERCPRELIDEARYVGSLGGEQTGPMSQEERERLVDRWRDALVERGWIAPHWPAQYGGADLSVMEQFVLSEVFAEMRAPALRVPDVGSTIMVHGSDELKSEFLPGMVKGDVRWCQGYSEPGSGSDLASLQTRAVRDGDDFVINGQKIWTSGAHEADMIFALVRTDPDAPKHRGITYLLFSMETPGISVRPLQQMTDARGFNEVFFEDVRVSTKGVVGEVDRGWYVGATHLDFERSQIGAAAGLRKVFGDLVSFATEEREADGPRQRLDETTIRHQLAECGIRAEVACLFSYRVVSLQDRGTIPNYEASVQKMFRSELSQLTSNTAVKTLGLYGQLYDREDPHTPMRTKWPRWYLATVSETIGAGTSEIQRNIIATRGLGLPRG